MSKRGFSIVELVIAIGILGSVVAIGTVSITGVQNRSQIKADKLAGAEIGHVVVTLDNYNSGVISGLIKYNEIPGFSRLSTKEYKPESMKGGYFVVAKENFDGEEKIMVGITRNGEAIAKNAVYDSGATPGWVWIEGGNIESILSAEPGDGECAHSYTSYVTAATCTETGTTTYTCSKCGDSYTQTIAATGHSWDEGVVTKEATTENEGEKTYTCTNGCGSTKTETIPMLSDCDHRYGTAVTTEPSCIGYGYTTYTCTICGYSYRATYTEPTGIHNYTYKLEDEEYLRSEATCTEDETYYYACSGCLRKSDTEYWTNPETALGHLFMYGETRTEATCTEDRTYYLKCSCGAVNKTSYYTDEGTAFGHNLYSYEMVDDTYDEIVCSISGCDYRSGELICHRFVDGYAYCIRDCGKSNEHPEIGGEIKGTITDGIVKIEWNLPQYDEFYILIFDGDGECIVDSTSATGSFTYDTGEKANAVYYLDAYEVEYLIDGVSYGWMTFNVPSLTEGVETIILN